MDKETLMWASLICEELALFYGCRALHLIKTTRISLLQSMEYIVFIQTLSIYMYNTDYMYALAECMCCFIKLLHKEVYTNGVYLRVCINIRTHTSL